ncbi:HAMP domain-containing protein [Paractinoplanes maris]|uniref:HAMP domain-containing protein n=1 Tax=Paractinoplanes maris TaxID=1734446 RepID=UPI0020205791|nr:HAMP domain-containing protein [Actinoplanes maris]
MRLRTQLTLAVTVLVALVVALAGLVIVVRIDHRDRDDLDRVLAARAEQVRAAAVKNGSLPTDGTFAIRLIADGEMLKQVGSSAGFPLPVDDGYSTVSSGDDEWRSLAETLVSGAQLQILVSLDALEEQHDDNVLVVDLLVLLAAVLSAAGVWFATGLVLRPFQRLLSAARDLGPDERLPEVTSPREVAELTTALNDLLARTRSAAPPSASPAQHPPTPDGLSPAEASAAEPAAADVPFGPQAAVAGPTVEMRTFESLSFAPPPPATPEPTSGPAPVAQPAAIEEAAAVEEFAPVAESAPVAEPARDQAAELRPSLADLGVQLDQLMDNPDMPATQRHLLLAQMADEHRHMVAVLNGDA